MFLTPQTHVRQWKTTASPLRVVRVYGVAVHEISAEQILHQDTDLKHIAPHPRPSITTQQQQQQRNKARTAPQQSSPPCPIIPPLHVSSATVSSYDPPMILLTYDPLNKLQPPTLRDASRFARSEAVRTVREGRKANYRGWRLPYGAYGR